MMKYTLTNKERKEFKNMMEKRRAEAIRHRALCEHRRIQIKTLKNCNGVRPIMEERKNTLAEIEV